MILALQTTTFSAFGGIPSYNRLVCRVLNEAVKSDTTEVLIATDGPEDIVSASATLPSIKLRAFENNRALLVKSVLRHAVTGNIDLALIGHVNYAPLGLILKRFQPRARVGVLLYGVEAWQPLPALKRHALTEADFFVAISEYTKRRATEVNSLDANRIYVLPNALEITASESSQPVSATERSKTTLLSVCRLDRNEQYKGVDHVIEVLSKVAEYVPDLEYIVVGEGSDLDRHKQLAEQCGVVDRVQFLGSISQDKLCECYKQCDVFVMPSGGEGFGFVFLEAMNYAKAIIAADSGGAPEVVKHDSTGKLVKYGNHEQLVSSLIELCTNVELRLRLGSTGKELLERDFTYTHFYKGLTEILSREMAGKFAETEDWAPANARSTG